MEQELLKDLLKQAPSNKTVVNWDSLGLMGQFFPNIMIEYALADKASLEEGCNAVNVNQILANWLFDLKSFYPSLSTGRVFLSIDHELINIELTVELPFSFGLENAQDFLQKNQMRWKRNFQHLSQKQKYRLSQKLSERVTSFQMNSILIKR